MRVIPIESWAMIITTSDRAQASRDRLVQKAEDQGERNEWAERSQE